MLHVSWPAYASGKDRVSLCCVVWKLNLFCLCLSLSELDAIQHSRQKVDTFLLLMNLFKVALVFRSYSRAELGCSCLCTLKVKVCVVESSQTQTLGLNWKHTRVVRLYSDQIRWSTENAGFLSHLNEVCLFWLWHSELQRLPQKKLKSAELFHHSWLCYTATASSSSRPRAVDSGRNRGRNLTAHNGSCYIN